MVRQLQQTSWAALPLQVFAVKFFGVCIFNKRTVMLPAGRCCSQCTLIQPAFLFSFSASLGCYLGLKGTEMAAEAAGGEVWRGRTLQESRRGKTQDSCVRARVHVSKHFMFPGTSAVRLLKGLRDHLLNILYNCLCLPCFPSL